MYFFEANQAGARFGYAPSAAVSEPVAAARTRYRWLALRRFRSGQIHYLVLKRSHNAARGSALAAAKALWCMTTAPLLALTRRDGRLQMLRGALHIGVVAAALGKAPHLEYLRPGSKED